jgi:hypothetical protein
MSQRSAVDPIRNPYRRIIIRLRLPLPSRLRWRGLALLTRPVRPINRLIPNIGSNLFSREQLIDIVIDNNLVKLDPLPAERAVRLMFKPLHAILADSMMHRADDDRHVASTIVAVEADVAFVDVGLESLANTLAHGTWMLG